MLNNCKTCPLNNTSPKVKDMGSKKSGIIFIGEAPHTEEIKQGRPFVGRSGKLLGKLLEKIGINREEVVVANALKCMIIPDIPKSVVNQAMKCCKPYLEDTILIANPKLIVCLGDNALKQLMGRNVGAISKQRGRILEYNGSLVIPTFHPAYVLRGCHPEFPDIDESIMYSRERLILKDFMLIKEVMNNGVKPIENKHGDYIPVSARQFRTQFAKSKILAFDVEWEGDKLLCMSATDTEGKAFVYTIWNNLIPKDVRTVLENPDIIKVVANRPSDEVMLSKLAGCNVKGTINDVFLMAHLIDENIEKISLEYLANTYSSLNYIKDVAKGKRLNLSELDFESLREYSGIDADATIRVYNSLKEHLKQDKKVLNYYVNFLQPVSDLLPVLKSYGCRIDIQKLKENEQYLKQHAQKIHDEAISMIPESIRKKYSDNLSLTRANLLIDYLFLSRKGARLKPKIFTGKTKVPSTAENHLILFKDNEFVNKLFEFKKLTKLISTYITPMYDYIHEDGRIYPDTFLYRTVTGRTAMTNPPIQQIPQRGSDYVKYIKELFIADDGYEMVAMDLGQSELRIMAWQANEKRMLEAFNNNIDIHALTASLVTGKKIEEITKEERHSAKGINFGFLYAMSANSFVSYAKEEYGIDITMEEAQEFRNRFFKAYPSIMGYHNVIKEYVWKHGFIYSPLGRKRRLPEINSPDNSERAKAERQAINFRIQSFSSDLGLLGMYLFYEAYRKDKILKDKVKLLWFIHDAIFFQAKKEVLDKAIDLAVRCLTERTKHYIYSKFKLVVDYPITCEVKVGRSWADLKTI